MVEGCETIVKTTVDKCGLNSALMWCIGEEVEEGAGKRNSGRKINLQEMIA